MLEICCRNARDVFFMLEKCERRSRYVLENLLEKCWRNAGDVLEMCWRFLEYFVVDA